jgi:hypothetical protein
MVPMGEVVDSINGLTGDVILAAGTGISLVPVGQTITINQTAGLGDWSFNGNTLGAKKTLGSIDNQDIGFLTNNTERITVLNGGNVGIGTAAPGAKLDVSEGTIRTFTTGTSYVQMAYGNSDSVPFMSSLNNGVISSATYGWGLFDRGTEGNFQLQYKAGATSWNPAITVQRSNGNVGIGTTAPTSKLQVVGLPVYANNAAAISGGLTVGAFYRTNADPDPVCVVH